MAEISPLRRRMIDDMMIRNLSPATQQSYLYAVAKFSRHFGRSPDRLDLEEVRARFFRRCYNSLLRIHDRRGRPFYPKENFTNVLSQAQECSSSWR